MSSIASDPPSNFNDKLQSNTEEDSVLTVKERMFHEAVTLGDETSIKLLLSTGVDVNSRNAEDRTVLHLAAGNGFLNIVELLHSKGASVFLADKYGMDALMWAAWFGHTHVITFLLKVGANIKIKNKTGVSFLHAGCAGGYLNVIELLAEYESEFDINTTDENGRTALHYCITYDKPDALSCLLQYESVDFFVKDKETGATALHLACIYNNLPCVKILLDCANDRLISNDTSAFGLETFHDFLGARDKNYFTALHIAAEEHNLDCVSLLLNYGADPNGFVAAIWNDYDQILQCVYVIL